MNDAFSLVSSHTSCHFNVCWYLLHAPVELIRVGVQAKQKPGEEHLNPAVDPSHRVRDADHRDGRLTVAVPRRRPIGFGLRAAQSAALGGEHEPPAAQPPSRLLPGLPREGARGTHGRPRPLPAAAGRAPHPDAETELTACSEPGDALHRAAEWCPWGENRG